MHCLFGDSLNSSVVEKFAAHCGGDDDDDRRERERERERKTRMGRKLHKSSGSSN